MSMSICIYAFIGVGFEISVLALSRRLRGWTTDQESNYQAVVVPQGAKAAARGIQPLGLATRNDRSRYLVYIRPHHTIFGNQSFSLGLMADMLTKSEASSVSASSSSESSPSDGFSLFELFLVAGDKQGPSDHEKRANYGLYRSLRPYGSGFIF
ncbi:hypothetical protein BDZ97DRAFT_1763854 [Flammula alnicola]|nr:hypothetical protein BDZ97DRAFT_1763854 [Flammula alnicola]